MTHLKMKNKVLNELPRDCKPLIIHDNDPDGLCSGIIVHRYTGGDTRRLIGRATLTSEWFERLGVKANKIVILDIPEVDQDFLSQHNMPVWIDHHMPLQRSNVVYVNPRNYDVNAYVPTTTMAHDFFGDEKTLWIAMVGSLADYHWPHFADEFKQMYPDLCTHDNIQDALTKDVVSELVRIFFFLLKGEREEVAQHVKDLYSVQSPYELLTQSTKQGKRLWNRYQKRNERFLAVLKHARSKNTRSKLLAYEYQPDTWSFTSYLANMLSTSLQGKTIIIARRDKGLMKCSCRGPNVLEAIQHVLPKVGGRGGGHPTACGASVPEDQWELFKKLLKSQL